MPALSSFAVANETTVTTNHDTRSHIIAGEGTNPRAFVIDDVVDDAPGYTLTFCNNCYPQFQNPSAFTFGDNANETRIIESNGFTQSGTTYTAATQVGRTTYFSDDAVGTTATGGRFRPLNQTHKVTLRNVKWGIESAGTGFAAARNNGFHFGGGLRANLSSGTTAGDGMPMICNGVRVYGRHGNSQMINKNLEVVNNTTLGYGLRMELWDSDADNLTFVLGFGAVPNTQYTGFQLARYNSSNVLVQAGFQVLSLANENVIPANGTLTFEGADVSGADMFNSRGGGNGSMVVNFIDPVGEPGRAVASLRRGNIRIFRTQKFNYSGAVFETDEDEHLVIDQTTSGAPGWATPANLTSHSGGTFSQALAVKQMPDTSGSFSNIYNNYKTFTVGYGYRRQVDSFSIATTGALPDRNITLTPDLMADGSRITALTPDENDEVDTLDELKRAAKTREVSHPHLAESEAYIITNANNEYEIKQHNGTAGNVLFTTAAHSSYFTTTSSGYTIHNADGSVTAGNAAGLRGAGIQVTGDGLTLDFPRSDNGGTTRRLSITGALNWVGAVHTAAGVNVGGLLEFSSGNLTRSFLTSTDGDIILTTARGGYVPGRVATTIADDAALSLEYTILGGAQETFASTNGAKYSSTLSGSTYGAATFDTTTFSDPKAYVEIADRQINAQTAYSIFHAGLLTLAGQKFLAANGATINVENIASSGQFVFLNGDTLLRRAASGNSNAALTAEPIRADDMFVEDDRGDVPYIPGISLGGINTKLDAIQTSVNNIDSGGGGASVAEIVTGIRAANFATSGTAMTLGQRLDTIDSDIADIPTAAQNAAATAGYDVDSVESGTQTLASKITAVKADTASIKTTVEAIDPLTAAEVTAAVPTAAAIATEVIGDLQTTDIDSSESGTQSVVGKINALPTAAQIVAALLARVLETRTESGESRNIDIEKALRIMLAHDIGVTTRNEDFTSITYERLDTAGTTAATVTTDLTTRRRTGVSVA